MRQRISKPYQWCFIFKLYSRRFGVLLRCVFQELLNPVMKESNTQEHYMTVLYVKRWDGKCYFRLGSAAPAFKNIQALFNSCQKVVVGYQDHEISLNDGDALTNLAILCLRKTSCSFPQSLHRSLRLPEMLLYFGFITSSSSIHSITFPQSHEIKCFGIECTYTEEE